MPYWEQKTKSKHTLVVNEDITIKSVSKEQDVFRVFKIDISSGEQVRIETVEGENEEEEDVICILIKGKKQQDFAS